MALGLRPRGGGLISSASHGKLGCDASSATRSRGYLARAGWSVLSTGSLPPMEPALDMEAVGRRIVDEVAQSWSRTYQHTIRPLGLHDGSFHYECIFSLPTDGKPVPSKVLHTKFALLAPSVKEGNLQPRLFYSFEEGDLRHEWRLEKNASGQWRATMTQQVVSIGKQAFEGFINRMIHEKQTAVNMFTGSLNTNFEAIRMKPPPAYTDEDLEGAIIWAEEEGGILKEEARNNGEFHLKVIPESTPEEDALAAEEQEAMKKALKSSGLACDLVAPPSSLLELLQNIFDAADEEGGGELPHYEVARLLGALLPGFDLEEWDIHKLLSSAQENVQGMIALPPFIEAAPEMIQGLRSRRKAYQARELPGVDITMDAVRYCFNDEIIETISTLMKVFEASWLEDDDRGKYTTTSHQSLNARKTLEQMQATHVSVMESHLPVIRGNTEDYTLVAFRRCHARACIESVPERLSPQQMERLMQILPEDEDAFLHIDTFNEQLESLHQQALQHAIVETDLQSLWAHLVQSFRKVGVNDDGKMKLWMLKKALLSADQLCLSRLQVHTLLCLATPSHDGLVDVAHFLGLCCQVIQHMFNAKIFAETAERLQLEHAEQSRKAENAELAAFAASTVIQTSNEEEKSAEHEVDQETVEKNLIQALSLSDDTHRNPPVLTPDVLFGVLHGTDVQVQACQLSDKELVGLAAEMPVDADGQVLYIDFIKRWVSHIFELRKNQLLSAYLQESALEGLEIPSTNVQALELLHPVLEAKRHISRRKSSKQSALDPSESEPVVKRSGSNSLPLRRSISHEASGGSRSSSKRSVTIESDGLGELDADGDQEMIARSHSDMPTSSTPLRQGLRKSMVERTRRVHDHGSHQTNVGDNPQGRGHLRRKAKLIAADEAHKREAELLQSHPPAAEKPGKVEEKSPKKPGRARVNVE
mmetsp:Transcript_10382/g.23459  ORF Transcript_10382/g.23459 Transcript_10382/m.23459 type:complete len:930 (-) Transcript_10382:109-2898(-)